MGLYKWQNTIRMPSPNDGNGTCFTRATTNTAIIKTKPEDKAKKLSELVVRDPTTALNFLKDKDFKCKEDKLTLELLSVIARQLSQQLRAMKLALEAFKAILYCHMLCFHQVQFPTSQLF